LRIIFSVAIKQENEARLLSLQIIRSLFVTAGDRQLEDPPELQSDRIDALPNEQLASMQQSTFASFMLPEAV
jgi:hypothetical protein